MSDTNPKISDEQLRQRVLSRWENEGGARPRDAQDDHAPAIADYLMAEGFAAAHIVGPHEIDRATPTPGVQPLPDATPAYPAAGDEAGATRVSRGSTNQVHLAGSP